MIRQLELLKLQLVLIIYVLYCFSQNQSCAFRLVSSPKHSQLSYPYRQTQLAVRWQQTDPSPSTPSAIAARDFQDSSGSSLNRSYYILYELESI